jgi:hypothetical protein
LYNYKYILSFIQHFIRTEKIIGKYRKRPADVNRYYMDSHKKQQVNSNRNKIFDDSKKNYRKIGVKEGLNTLKYSVNEIRIKLLYTQLIVDHPTSFEQN